MSFPNKPLDAFNAVFDGLKDSGENFILNKNEMIPLFSSGNTPHLIFINIGRFSIYRRYDELLMHSSSSPSFLGVAEYIQARNAHFVLADTECSGFKIDAGLAFAILTESGLWQKVCEILTYFIQILQTRDLQLVGVNAYLTIKNKLLELLQEPEQLRMTQSVLSYIQLRSKLSKSLVSKILADLRTGGYICMKSGKLISIKHLPRDY